MCGIAGLVDFKGIHGAKGLRDLAVAMSDTMVHRGPDSSGVWVDPAGYCAFSHRRLSIIDISSAGHQPMESSDKRYCITFNGEIYNFLELRPEIEAKGHIFRTRTDTEVLIEAIRLWGAGAFLKMDGMYAFGLYDSEKKEILIGRDPFGEKPLYYVATPQFFAFASELQALQQLPFFDSSISVDALAEYLCFQYIGAPRSLYSQVKKLPPGHYLVLRDDASYAVYRYFKFKPGQGELLKGSLDELADELEDILLRSIKRRLISDVPLGAFLSGGVDSSTVVALIRKALKLPVKTFSIGFAGTEETEHVAAKRFAEHLTTEHREKILTPDASEFLFRAGDLLDEPNGDSSCLPTYLLSEFARSEVTVAVSGDGGDEMLGGYGRYFSTLEEEAHAKEGATHGWNPGDAYYSSRILVFPEEHIRELFGFVPVGLRNILSSLRREISSGGSASLLDRMRRTDMENYMPGAVLPKVDRMSMQHALEVRTPFLSMELSRFAERLPLEAMYSKGTGKLILRKLAYRYLPEELVNAPKRGFGLPMSRWGCEELLKTAGELLEADDSKIAACLGKATVKRFMTRQRGEHGFSTYQVWALTVLESYLRRRTASLPDLQSGVSLEMLPYAASDCQELSLLQSFLEKRHPVVLFCEDELPSILRELPEGSIIASNLAIKENSGVKTIALEWADESFSWIDSLPKDSVQGAIAWFYPKNFVHRMSMQWAMSLAKAGFREIVFSGKEPHSYTSLNLQKFTFDETEKQKIHSEVKKIGKRLGEKVAFGASVGCDSNAFSTQGKSRRIFRGFLDKMAQRLGVDTPIHNETGHAYTCQLKFDNRLENAEACHMYMLFEDGVPLWKPGSIHEDIRKFGEGRYSVWNKWVIFSASDNSDPNANGKAYHLLELKLWKKLLCSFFFGEAYRVHHWGGYAYSVKSPFPETAQNKELSYKYILFEDGTPLLSSGCTHADIANMGGGRYSVYNNNVVFSASDNSDPNLNGRCYYLAERRPEYEHLYYFNHKDLPDASREPFSISLYNLFNKLVTPLLPLGTKRRDFTYQKFSKAYSFLHRLFHPEEKKPVKDHFYHKDLKFLPLFGEAIKLDNELPVNVSLAPGSKIALFTHALSSGGAERQWCYLARELDKHGYSVTLVILHSLEGGNGHYLPLLQGTGVSVYSLKDAGIEFNRRHLSESNKEFNSLLTHVPAYLTRDVAPLFLYLREIQPQYLLCQLDGINIIGGVAAWLAGVPRILLSTRNVNPSYFEHIYNPWFKDYYVALLSSHRVVMTGNSLVGNKDYAEWLGFPLERYHLIRNGVDTANFDKVTSDQMDALKREFKLSAESQLLCAVFRLSPEKQPMIFLEVVEKLHRKLPKLKAVLAGEGPLHKEVQGEINRRGLGDTVSLLGRREDVAAIIKLSDVFLLTSAQEGTPNVLLEAQYMGVPVVASSVGGVPDAMMDGDTGFMCPPDDPDRMAERCLFLLTHEDERKRMGEAGRRFIIDNFSINNMVQKTLAALGGKRE